MDRLPLHSDSLPEEYPTRKAAKVSISQRRLPSVPEMTTCIFAPRRTSKYVEATSKPPRSHLEATSKPPRSTSKCFEVHLEVG